MKTIALALLTALAVLFLAPLAAAQDADAAEAEAIRQRAEAYVAAYNALDADALAGLWAEHAVYLNRETGESIDGRPAIRQMFADMFATGEAAGLAVTIQSIRLVTPDVAIEDGTAEIIPAEGEPTASTYTAIHVKQDGQWYLHSVRETDVPAAPAREPSPLDDLAWLVGEWVDEADDAAVHTSWQWAKNERFLVGNFAVSIGGQLEMEGTQVIGWDAANRVIRSWVFDSEGGIGNGAWKRQGEVWVVDTTSVLRDGSRASATNIYTPVDENTFTFRSVGRAIDDEQQPDVEEIAVHRQVEVASADVAPEQTANGGN